jgi:predicted Zn-dependent protease
MLRAVSFSNIVLAAFLIASVGLNASAANKKNALPEIGVVASSAISLDKEIIIGDALMRQLRRQAPLVNDPLLDEYIQDLGNRLVAQAENVKFPFKFFLINSPDINAFAFFGGHVGIHTGLIFNAKNESELASVLAHEVSHVTQRHIARSIEARQKASPLQLASMLGGLLVAMANPEAGIAAISAGQAVGQQTSINFTRSNEKEADRIGIAILAQAGFDPNGASDFFNTLTQKYRLRSNLTPFLMTHPLPESRIADARTRAATYRPRIIAPSLNFHLAKARIHARYFANPDRNIENFSARLEKQTYVIKEAAEYGLALSYLADEQYAKAKALIDKLLTLAPDNLFYLDTFTDIALATGNYQEAIDSLSAHARHTPHNRVLALNLANAQIKNKQFSEATRILKDYLLINPTNLLAYQLLSDAYGENQQKLEMHQSKAEVYALTAAYPRAIDELQNAYNFAGQRQLEKQRIRGRINQLRTAQDRLRTL